MVFCTHFLSPQVSGHLDPSSSRTKSPITTHILDVSLGKPASGVGIKLFQCLDTNGTAWKMLAEGRTDADGRCGNLLHPQFTLEPGRYRLDFDTGTYLQVRHAIG